MLINSSESHVEFISYTGHYPNLCSGMLTLRIDGDIVKFGHDLSCKYDFKTGKYLDDNYNKFWMSGGCIKYINGNYTTKKNSWIIDANKLPDKYKQYAAEIDVVFNKNVSYGCCGGCS